MPGRRERRGDHELDGGGTEVYKARNKGDCFVDRSDGNPCHARYAGARNRLYHRFGDECERTLGSDEEASKDLQWRFAVEKRTEPKPCVFLIAYL